MLIFWKLDLNRNKLRENINKKENFTVTADFLHEILRFQLFSFIYEAKYLTILRKNFPTSQYTVKRLATIILCYTGYDTDKVLIKESILL